MLGNLIASYTFLYRDWTFVIINTHIPFEIETYKTYKLLTEKTSTC